MSDIVEINKVLTGARTMLDAVLPAGILVGAGKAPDGAGDGYVVVYAATNAARDLGSFGNPEGSGRVRLQVTSVGSTDEQANAVMDACLTALLSTEATGGFTNAITATDHEVWYRAKVADVGSANEGPEFQRTVLLDLSVSRV